MDIVKQSWSTLELDTFLFDLFSQLLRSHTPFPLNSRRDTCIILSFVAFAFSVVRRENCDRMRPPLFFTLLPSSLRASSPDGHGFVLGLKGIQDFAAEHSSLHLLLRRPRTPSAGRRWGVEFWSIGYAEKEGSHSKEKLMRIFISRRP